MKRPQDDFQIVFIIGAARSGTRLLRDLIALHPEVDCVPYDINFIWRLGNEGLPHDELTSELATTEVIKRIRAKMFRYHRNGKVLLEKTVSNCLRVPFVLKVFPEARMIHLLRDGVDVVESAFRQWTAPPDWIYIFKKAMQYPFKDAFRYAAQYAWKTAGKLFIQSHRQKAPWGPLYQGIHQDLTEKSFLEICAIQWSRCVQKAWEDLSKQPPDKLITVHYEALVSNTLDELQKIGGFLHLDPAPYQSQPYRDIICQKNIGKGMLYLNEAQRALIQPYLAHIQALTDPKINAEA